MSIPFTQYLRPNGRQRAIEIDMPVEIEELAQRFIEAGGSYEAEILTTGDVSLTASFPVDGEPEDIAIALAPNGPGIDDAVESVVRDSVKWLGKR